MKQVPCWGHTIRHHHKKFSCGLGSSVGIATGYSLDGLGIETWWGRDFPHLSRLALRPTQPPAQWVPGVKNGRGVTLTPYPLLVPWSRSYTSTTLMGRVARKELQCLYKGVLYPFYTKFSFQSDLRSMHPCSKITLRRSVRHCR